MMMVLAIVIMMSVLVLKTADDVDDECDGVDGDDGEVDDVRVQSLKVSSI